MTYHNSHLECQKIFYSLILPNKKDQSEVAGTSVRTHKAFGISGDHAIKHLALVLILQHLFTYLCERTFPEFLLQQSLLVTQLFAVGH